jgi:hypothetical protein
MQPLEDRFDSIEVMLGRIVLENDRGLKRLDRLEQLFERSEKRAEEERLRAEQDRLRADKDRERAEQDRKRADQDRARAEKDRQRAEEDRKAWNKKWGDLANKLGTVVEDIVAPNLPRIAREDFGCDEPDDFIIRRWVRNKRDRSRRREFDLIAVCGDKVILNETKSNPAIEYIDAFVEVLPELVDYCPEYRGKTLVPVFSSLYLGEDVVNYLTKRGIYAMAMGDETMDLVNVERMAERSLVVL